MRSMRCTSPGDWLLITVGVTNTTSSVSSFLKRLERNRAPSTGRSPRNGTLSMFWLVLRDISPDSTMVSPFCTLNSVKVRRTLSAGPAAVEMEGSMLLTSLSISARRDLELDAVGLEHDGRPVDARCDIGVLAASQEFGFGAVARRQLRLR